MNLDNILDALLPASLPLEFTSCIASSELRLGRVYDAQVIAEDDYSHCARCCLISKAPSTVFDWSAAYHDDADTRKILAALKVSNKKCIPDKVITSVSMGYRHHLRNNLIQMLGDKLILLKPINMGDKYMSLIVTPDSIRRKIFSHYHAGPSGGHMGEYKTLFRIRMRFFWPGLREDIKNWVRQCAHCVAYNVWRSRASEMHFSWPITVPFWIMHVDLWSPGVNEDMDGNKGYLMNSMCDITQFIVSSPTVDITAANLAQMFCADVIFSFGMCSVVVVDDGSSFKNVFMDMCKRLGLTYWVLSRGNHKGNSVERYHRFLNKTQAIAGNDRGTHDVYIQNAKTSQYAWNSAPIDGTDVVRSMAAVGRTFRFPLDIDLSPTPILNTETNSTLFHYLRDVSTDSTFSLAILQVLIQERRESHQHRQNKGKLACTLKVGDVVKAHVQVQSRADTGVVGKLSYRARGPFVITTDLGNGSSEVQRYGDSTSATRKYKNTELYLLPPALFPSEPLDLLDQKYLDCNHAPIVSPLLKPMQIELYNDKWLDSKQAKIKTKSTHVDLPSNDLDSLAFKPHSKPTIPTLSELFQDNTISQVAQPSIVETVNTVASAGIHADILSSNDKLFFISCTVSGTMKRKWYLVKVDLEASEQSCAEFASTSLYYCSFLAKHPADMNKSDEYSRWWPDWYKYSRDSVTNDIIYGYRMLFRPSMNPDPAKYIEWADTVNFAEPNTILTGPFDFEKISSSNRTRNKVSGEDWRNLCDKCALDGLLPPTTGSSTFNIPINNGSRKRSKKRKI